MNLNSFEKIPTGKTSLEHIIKKASLLIRLDRAVKSLLPPMLKANLRVANYRHHILIIEVTSATWLTRLNYERPQLLSTLRAQLLPALIAINLKVNPSIYSHHQPLQTRLTQPEQSAVSVNPMSHGTAELLKELGDKSSDNLKQRLARLTHLAQSLPKIVP